MYEEILKSSRNSFFALLNVVFPDDIMEENNDLQERFNTGEDKTNLIRMAENEWMQEYHIIYNSYVLEGKDPSGQEDL